MWVGLSCSLTPEGEVHMLSEVEQLRLGAGLPGNPRRGDVNWRPPCLAVMHSDVPCISPALKAARSKWEGPLAAYANSGTFS